MDKYKTSQLGQALKKVYHGEITIDDSVQQAVNEIKGVFGAPENSPESDKYFGFAGDEIGTCPLCGNTVVRGKYGYQCKGYKDGCKFSIPGILCKRVITPTNAKSLLETGETEKLDGFISKTGKSFSARLILDENRKTSFKFED